jgi:1-deoxy-D-xylulose-5-phosphate synthase
MGMTYLGPVDGHNVNNLIDLLRFAREMKRPVLLHVMTQKGKGYVHAENEPSKFHGISPFDPITGSKLNKPGKTFSAVFGEIMCALAERNPKVCAITAAMPGGTGLLDYAQKHKTRLFDVGIAEEHAVSMAGGLAKQGMIPVVALYSTFLQRSYDQILQDVAMLNLHVVFAVDRAGLVGEDGETHHGVFDIGFLRQVPGMTVLCPGSCRELQDMLSWAVEEGSGPIAIRYPRGGDSSYRESHFAGGKTAVACHREGKDAVIVVYGTMVQNAMDAAQILARQGIEATVLRLLRVNPLPMEEILPMIPKNCPVIVAEEAGNGSGIRESLAWELCCARPGQPVDSINLGDCFATHGKMADLYRHYGLDAEGIANRVLKVIRNEG